MPKQQSTPSFGAYLIADTAFYGRDSYGAYQTLQAATDNALLQLQAGKDINPNAFTFTRRELAGLKALPNVLRLCQLFPKAKNNEHMRLVGLMGIALSYRTEECGPTGLNMLAQVCRTLRSKPLHHQDGLQLLKDAVTDAVRLLNLGYDTVRPDLADRLQAAASWPNKVNWQTGATMPTFDATQQFVMGEYHCLWPVWGTAKGALLPFLTAYTTQSQSTHNLPPFGAFMRALSREFINVSE